MALRRDLSTEAGTRPSKEAGATPPRLSRSLHRSPPSSPVYRIRSPDGSFPAAPPPVFVRPQSAAPVLTTRRHTPTRALRPSRSQPTASSSTSARLPQRSQAAAQQKVAYSPQRLAWCTDVRREGLTRIPSSHSMAEAVATSHKIRALSQSHPRKSKLQPSASRRAVLQLTQPPITQSLAQALRAISSLEEPPAKMPMALHSGVLIPGWEPVAELPPAGISGRDDIHPHKGVSQAMDALVDALQTKCPES